MEAVDAFGLSCQLRHDGNEDTCRRQRRHNGLLSARPADEGGTGGKVGSVGCSVVVLEVVNPRVVAAQASTGPGLPCRIRLPANSRQGGGYVAGQFATDTWGGIAVGVRRLNTR